MQVLARRLVAFLALALPVPAAAAPVGGTEQPLPPPNVFRSLGVVDGLPTGNIADIEQDRQGYMWLATQEGLARYGGDEVVTFRQDSGLTSNFTTQLAVSGDGTLWVGTLDGLNRSTGDGKFVPVKLDETLLAITALAATKDVLWLGAQPGAVARLSLPDAKVTLQLDLGEVTIHQLLIDRDGSLWIATSAGLYQLPAGADKPKRVGAFAAVTAIVRAGDTLYVAGPGEVVTLDPATGRTASVKTNRGTLAFPEVTSLLHEPPSRLWIGTEQGLHRADIKTGEVLTFPLDRTNPAMLHSDHIAVEYLDRDNVLWFGTRTAGAAIVDPQRFVFSPYPPTEGSVGGMAVDSTGTMWVGTAEPGTLAIYDRARQVKKVYTVLGAEGGKQFDLSPYWVTTVLASRSGPIWIGTDRAGVIRYDPQTAAVDVFDESTGLSNGVFALAEDSSGGILIGTWGNGLFRIDAQNAVKAIGGEALAEAHFYALLVDRFDPDVVWGGVAGGGLFQIPLAGGEITSYANDPDKPETISHSDVTSIWQRDDKTLWIGTYGGGLNSFDPKTKKFKRYGITEGIPENTVYGVLGGDDGSVWLSTLTRLIRVDADGKTTTVFGAADGVISEFSQGAYHRSPQGELLFAGPTGFNVFLPAKVARRADPPAIAISHLEVSNQARPIPALSADRRYDTVEMIHSDSSLALQLSVLSYGAPESHRVRYRMAGWDRDWQEAPLKRGELVYGRIDSGSYELQIKVSSRFGEWTKEMLVIPVEVAPPLWRTWWAYASYAIVLFAIAYIGWRYQRQKIVRLETEQRLATVEKDLALSAAVQHGFLPDAPAHQHGSFRLEGFWRAAAACSGDWWLYEKTSDGKYIIVVGDVTGHGAGPAMVTAAVATAFRVTGSLSLEDRLTVLNREVIAVGKDQYHMTIAAVELDPETGEYEYFSAGAPPMLHLPSKGNPKPISARGTPLGSRSFIPGIRTGVLDPACRLLLYTDGIPEVQLGEGGGIFGMRRFSQLFASTREMPVHEAVTTIVTTADKLRGIGPQDDDWTLVLFERFATANVSIAPGLPPARLD